MPSFGEDLMRGKPTRGFGKKGEGEAGKKCEQELQSVRVCKAVDFLLFETKEKMFKQNLTNFTQHVYIKKKRGKKYSNHLVKVIVTYLCFHYYLS